MSEVKKELDVVKVLRLMHVPEVKEQIYYQIKMIEEGETRECIEEYYERKDTYYKALMPEPREKKGGYRPLEEFIAERSVPETYWFELSRFEEGVWVVTGKGPEGANKQTILPADIVDMISGEVPVDPDKVETRTGLFSQQVTTHFDLKFIRASSNHIYGTVQENRKAGRKLESILIEPQTLQQAKAEDGFFYYVSELKRSHFMRHIFMDAFTKYIEPLLEYLSIRPNLYGEISDFSSQFIFKREEMDMSKEEYWAVWEKTRTLTQEDLDRASPMKWQEEQERKARENAD
ncbi:MAG: hypothetical protein GY757_54440 [bacterium]|nr:hypothetical protein [bacterium]